MNMKKTFIYIFTSLLLFSGCSRTDLTSKDSIVIPFGTCINDDESLMPCVDVSIGNVKLTLLIDSGARFSSLSYTGLNKLNYDKNYELNINDVTEEEYKSYLRQGCNPIVTRREIFIHDSIPIQEVEFDEEWYDNGFDGILGFNFFEDYSNITIDYNKKQILLDAKKLNVENLKLQRDEHFYYTDFNFDSVMETSIIDTGLNSQSIPAVKLSETNCLYDRFAHLEGKHIGENFSLGNIIYDTVYFADYDSSVVDFSHPASSSIISQFNILSNGCFVNHIIQFDFEDMVFRIK